MKLCIFVMLYPILPIPSLFRKIHILVLYSCCTRYSYLYLCIIAYDPCGVSFGGIAWTWNLHGEGQSCTKMLATVEYLLVSVVFSLFLH